jgi:hypothetical protein
VRVRTEERKTKQIQLSLKIMKCNPWTLGLIGAGLVSLPAVMQAEEKPSSLITAVSPTTLSGYIDTSMNWNPGSGGPANLPAYLPNGASGTTVADGFNLNVVSLNLSKPTGEGDWGAGYNVQLLFGPSAVGYNNSPFGVTGGLPSDFSLKDTYVSLHAPVGNGLDFKIGTWSELLGYEVYDYGSNPNWTRSYGYEIEPTQQTGLQMNYQFCPYFSVAGAIANTWSAGVNARANPPSEPPPNKSEWFECYSGVMTFTCPTNWGFLSGSTMSGGAITGFDAVNHVNKTSFYTGGTVNTPLTGLKAGYAFDYLNVANEDGETWVLGGYLSYQATEKLGFYGRAEYMRDRGEQKVFVATGPGGTVDTMPDKSMELTGTIQYDLWKNVLSRLEVRWDHSLSGQGVWGGETSNTDVPGSGYSRNAVVLLANFIYKF